MEQEPTFELKTASQLNIFLAGVLKDLRRGKLTVEEAKGHSIVADKINKNNVNILEYKKLTKNKEELDFFKNSQ